MSRNSRQFRNGPVTPVTALVANTLGEIFELDGFGAVGMAGIEMTLLQPGNTVSLPYGSELMYLPDRRPVLYNLATGKTEVVFEDPYDPGKPIFPVASFNSPGFVTSYVPAYAEDDGAGYLPLFSYAAVGWLDDGFRSAVFEVDREPRQDLRQMPLDKVSKGVVALQKRLPQNRLARHLEKCALTYGCPAAKNLFIGRYEAPLPTSPYCNARCLGCISKQPANGISHCQDRIGFMPSPEEIAEIALVHLGRVPKGVVSFGQGCEGDPLMAAEVILPAIHLIRARTDKGTINMNTNGSLPTVLETLFNAGLDSIRVSVNSFRESCYLKYFRPKGYGFSDVLKSIELGIRKRKHVAINYLNSPGFTDSPAEYAAIMDFLDKHPIHQIQWRNLNFDPLQYWHIMATGEGQEKPVGMRKLVNDIKTRFPRLRHGYFNPPIDRGQILS